MIPGNIACAQANMLNLGLMVNSLPDGSVWSAGGVGNPQLQMNAISLASGGGVRIGLEDNIWYDAERNRLATNVELVERTLTIAESMKCRPCTHREARELLVASTPDE